MIKIEITEATAAEAILQLDTALKALRLLDNNTAENRDKVYGDIKDLTSLIATR